MVLEFEALWTLLRTSPFTYLCLTLIAYQVGMWIFRKAGRRPIFNPVLLAIIVVVAVLVGTGTTYADYLEGAQFIHFLLGPATVALAIPLYRQFNKVRRSGLAILISLLCGSIASASLAVIIAMGLGASQTTQLALAPHSVTAPVAMGIVEKLGGLPSLTAVLVIATGIIGAALGPYILDFVGVKRWSARGLAIGTVSHGIGTGHKIQVNEEAGAFSGLAMGLNALATAVLLPILWYWAFG